MEVRKATEQDLETFQGNMQAINFYKKNQWSLVKEEKDETYGFGRVFFEKAE